MLIHLKAEHKILVCLVLGVFLILSGFAFGILALTSCETMNVHLPAIPDAPQDRLAMAQNLYTGQIDDYKTQIARPNLSEEMKELLRHKKKFLEHADHVIMTYRTFVKAGQSPTPDAEQAILDLINDLQTMAMGG